MPGVLYPVFHVAIAAWLLLSGIALAHVSSSLSSKPSAAFALLSGRLADPEGTNLPRLSNAEDRLQLTAIYDLGEVVAARPAGAETLPALLQWSDAASRTNNAYIYARRANSSEAIEANIKEYAEEVSLGALFNFRLSVTMHQAGTAFMASLPEKDAKTEARQEGWKRMVLGIYQQVSGLLMMEFSGPPLAAGSDARAAYALAQDMPIISRSFSDEQKAALISQFEKALKSASSDATPGLSAALIHLKRGANPQ